MSDAQVQHESLLLRGYWRITAFGKLAQNPRAAGPDLRIRTYLAPLAGTADTTAAVGSIIGSPKPMLLPVGELPRLHLNAILHDGRLLSHRIHHLQNEQTVTRTLNCHRENVTVFERRERDEFGDRIIPVREKWAHQLEDDEVQGLFVAIGSLQDQYATIIPAVEVFRFFYATSDVLAKALLQDKFLDPGTNIWNPEKTARLSDGRVVLWLRKHMLDADARFLARFAFDNYALRQAQRIFLYSSAPGSIGGERALWSIPPFEDSVRTEFVCFPIGGPDGKRVLVTRLLRCDWKPPWSELKWDRDNDGRVDPDKRKERDPAEWSPGLLTVPDEENPEPSMLANVPPSGANVPSRLKEEEISERFPELGKTPADKLPQEGATTRADHEDWRPVAEEAYLGSVVEGQSSMEMVGRTIIEGLEQKPESTSVETDEVNAEVGEEEYLKILSLLLLIAAHSIAKVEFLVVLDTRKTVRGVDFNVFPAEIDGKRKAWLYVDENEKDRRMALIAEVGYEDRWRYVIELQHKREGECSTLVVWNHEERRLVPGMLGQLLKDCARGGEAKPRHAKLYGVFWGRLRHTTKGQDKEAARHYLERIMTAMPESAQT